MSKRLRRATCRHMSSCWRSGPAIPAGRVLAADHDLVGKLDVEGVKYREATSFERHVAGFID